MYFLSEDFVSRSQTMLSNLKQCKQLARSLSSKLSTPANELLQSPVFNLSFLSCFASYKTTVISHMNF